MKRQKEGEKQELERISSMENASDETIISKNSIDHALIISSSSYQLSNWRRSYLHRSNKILSRHYVYYEYREARRQAGRDTKRIESIT